MLFKIIFRGTFCMYEKPCTAWCDWGWLYLPLQNHSGICRIELCSYIPGLFLLYRIKSTSWKVIVSISHKQCEQQARVDGYRLSQRLRMCNDLDVSLRFAPSQPLKVTYMFSILIRSQNNRICSKRLCEYSERCLNFIFTMAKQNYSLKFFLGQ